MDMKRTVKVNGIIEFMRASMARVSNNLPNKTGREKKRENYFYSHTII